MSDRTAVVVEDYRQQITAGLTPNLPPQFAPAVLAAITDEQRAAYRQRAGLPAEARP